MADLFSYFNESDLELTGDHLGHLNEESRLVGVVFNDVVIHVDEDPEAQKQTQKKGYSSSGTSGPMCFITC